MTCSVRGCGRPERSRGLCHNHYEYRRRHDPDPKLWSSRWSPPVGLSRIKIPYLTPLEVGYFAGLVDGEGSITTGRNGARGSAPFVQLLVTGTDAKLANWLLGKIGGNVHWKRRTKAKWKPEFTWRATHQRAELLIELIQPHLVVKEDQALLAITLGAAKDVFRGSLGAKRWTAGELEAFDLIADLMAIANRRGVQEAGASTVDSRLAEILEVAA